MAECSSCTDKTFREDPLFVLYTVSRFVVACVLLKFPRTVLSSRYGKIIEKHKPQRLLYEIIGYTLLIRCLLIHMIIGSFSEILCVVLS